LGTAITDQNNRVAGQHADTLLAQLKQFKASTLGDVDGTMTSAAQAVSATDSDVLVGCLSTLAAP